MNEDYGNENYTGETSVPSEETKRKVVVPGEIIISGEDYLPGEGTRRDGKDVIASRFGLAEEMGKVVRVIYIFGAFIPRRNNLVIGDVVSAKIFGVKSKGLDLSLKGRGLVKLEGGFVFRITPSRVPRVIGREGSMIGLIKEKTGCNITVGQNGWIWINGPDFDSQIKARNAIEMVAEKVHVSGLTELMEKWFEENDK